MLSHISHQQTLCIIAGLKIFLFLFLTYFAYLCNAFNNQPLLLLQKYETEKDDREIKGEMHAISVIF